MKSAHHRIYVPGAVALVKGRVRMGLKLMPQDEIEHLMKESHFLDRAPFLWVGLIYRYGIKNNLKVEFQRINKKYGDLPIALELDMQILQWADRHNLKLLKDIMMIAALEAFIQVGQKYQLPTDIFEKERTKYGNIPDTTEECEAYPL